MWQRTVRFGVAGALAAGLAAGACGGENANTNTGTPDAGTTQTGTPDAGVVDDSPSLTITSPSAPREWELPNDAEESFPVEFTVKNFTLKPEGECAGAANCGQVRVHVDGAACNWDELDFNAVAVASPGYAAFRPCPDPTGKHTISVELWDDAGKAVKDASGKAVKATVEVTMKENLTDPAVGITAPDPDSIVDIAGTESADVEVAVERFTLKAAGTCAGAENCGHLHLFIDGDECTAAGDEDNNEGVSPLKALFDKCKTPVGDHVIDVELHDDDHEAVYDQYDNVIGDYIFVTTREER